MAFPTGWAWSTPITIPLAQISGSNTNFPVMLTEVNFPSTMIDGGVASALNGGGDVRFSEDSAGLTQLPCEIVFFITGGTPSAEVWVKLPTLNSGADKTVYVWYQESSGSLTQPLVTDPFGRNAVWADYSLVMHLGSSASLDSSGNQTVTVFGAPTTVSQNMRYFDGLADYLSVADNTKLNISSTSTCSASIRVRADYSGNYHIIFAKYTGAGATTEQGYRIFYNAPKYTKFGIADYGFNGVVLNTSGKDFISFTLNGTTSNCYFNGVVNGVINTTSTALRTNTYAVSIMRMAGLTYSKGYLGELRYTNTIVRSANWITTEYNNQSNPAAFATAGTPVAVSGIAFNPAWAYYINILIGGM